MNEINEIELLPSVIILKNSIAEGRVPLDTDLETGEIALGLHGGSENIWAKNSDGQIVNLRSPRHDLFWGDLFLSFSDKATFEEALGRGEVKNTCLVYIKAESLIWNDGDYYSTNYSEDDIIGITRKYTITLPKSVTTISSGDIKQVILEKLFPEVSTIEERIKGLTDMFALIRDSSGLLTGSINLKDSVGTGGYAPVSLYCETLDSSTTGLKLSWMASDICGYVHIIYNSDSSEITVQDSYSVSLGKINYLSERVDNIYSGNKDLVVPMISGTWNFYNAAGGVITIDGVPGSTVFPVIEKGYWARFIGTYKWTSAVGKKDPTGVASNSSFQDLPRSGQNSQEYTELFKSPDVSAGYIVARISAPKTGLMVKGTNVVESEGLDYTQANWTVSFRDRLYHGSLGKDTGITEADIKGLPNTSLVSGRAMTIRNVSPSPTEWYIYAYPKSLGPLSQIIQDGATPVLGAFKMIEMTITNTPGIQVPLYVYVTNNPGAFTGATLEFK